MSQTRTDGSRSDAARSGSTAPTTGMVGRIWRKTAEPANVTYRWIFLSMIVGFSFIGVAIFAAVTAVNADNKLSRDQSARALIQQYTACRTTNERRAEAKVIALGDVQNDQEALDSDRDSWTKIDALFPDGIPEPAHSSVFDGLDRRQRNIDAQLGRIAETYESTDCERLLPASPPDTSSTN